MKWFKRDSNRHWESVPFSGQQNSVAQTVRSMADGSTCQRAEEPYGLLLYREKRIRKDFGKRPQVLDVPYLLLSSLTRFRNLSSKILKGSMAGSCFPFRIPDSELQR